MTTLYNQYIYKGGEWKQTGGASDAISYTLSRSGNNIVLTGSDGSTTTAPAQSILTFDSAPVSGSTNPVTSNGVYSELSTKADLNSPSFTGTPVAPTAASSTNTTQLATTAFVQNVISGKQNSITISNTEPTASDGSNGDIWLIYTE